MRSEYTKWLARWGANAERLNRIGIVPFGFDPGFLCSIKGSNQSVNIPDFLADVICDLVKKAYPETEDDKLMIKAYKKRQNERNK